MKLRITFIIIMTLLLIGWGTGNGRAAPTDATYQTLPFTQAWANPALITTHDNWSGVAGIMGYRGDGLTAAQDADPQTLLQDDLPGVEDVNANQTNPNTFSTGGVAEFDLTDDVVALTGSGTADAPYLLLHLDTTGLGNIRVQYNLRDLDGSVDNAVQQIALHYRVGNSGSFSNVPAAYVADATTGPSQATLVTPIDVTLPAAVNDQPQVQLRIMTTNATSNDEWVGIDDISITGEALTYQTIALDGTVNSSEWGNGLLGTANSTTFGITWDDDFWYFGVSGGFSNTDFFMVGIDIDPTNETSGNTGGTADRCGGNFPSENKPDYILVNRQNSYLRESYGWNGSAWDQTAFNPSEPADYDFSGGGGDYEVRLRKSAVFGSNADSSPVGFYLWLSNGSCQFFNAWPPENHNGWTGGSEFLFAAMRFDTTDNGRFPNDYGRRVAWASHTLSSDSTTYNYFGGDDSSGSNPWLQLTTTAGGNGGPICTVRAKAVAANAMQQGAGNFTGINRYIDFTLTNCTNLNVNVQMRYEPGELNGITEANRTFYHCPAVPCSAAWVAVTGSSYDRTGTNNLILTNVAQDQFSFWTIGDGNTPTAVSLQTFHITPSTSVTWLLLLTLISLSWLTWQLTRRPTPAKPD